MVVQWSGVPVVEWLAAVELSSLRAGPEAVVWSAAVWERVRSRLTDRQQRVVYLHALLGHSHTECAALLGVCRGAIDGAWRRALERIRDALPD